MRLLRTSAASESLNVKGLEEHPFDISTRWNAPLSIYWVAPKVRLRAQAVEPELENAPTPITAGASLKLCSQVQILSPSFFQPFGAATDLHATCTTPRSRMRKHIASLGAAVGAGIFISNIHVTSCSSIWSLPSERGGQCSLKVSGACWARVLMSRPRAVGAYNPLG